MTVLTSAIQAINQLNLNTSLANSNNTKLGEMTESLFTSLRDAIDGQDVSSMTIDDDEVAKLEAIMLRISLLSKSRNIVEVMDDEEGGQSSGWEIICAFAGRGELPYKDEAKVSLRSTTLPAYMDHPADQLRSSNTPFRLSSCTSRGCSRTLPRRTRTTP